MAVYINKLPSYVSAEPGASCHPQREDQAHQAHHSLDGDEEAQTYFCVVPVFWTRARPLFPVAGSGGFLHVRRVYTIPLDAKAYNRVADD